MPVLSPELVADFQQVADAIFWAGAGFGLGVGLTFSAFLYLVAMKRAIP